MIERVRNPDVLGALGARVLDAGAARFGVEDEGGEEHVMAVSGGVGVGIARFPADSEDAFRAAITRI